MFARVRTVKLVALAVAAFMVTTLADERLDTPLTFMDAAEMKGMVRVSKLKTVLVELDENPDVYIFVVNSELITFES